jgi:hypothetical protein
LLKPSGRDEEELPFRLAPFILEKVTERRQTAPNNGVGALMLTNGGVGLNWLQPTVYFEVDSVLVRGLPHVRLAYVWFFSETGRARAISAQGVRLTLNSGGQPVIWEVLTDRSAREVMFASHQLETAAAAQFGPPLASRRYSLERGSSETPAVVLARVIEDGPVPMGPMVYVQEPNQSVSTLLCRCMPAQARRLRNTATYRLEPWLNVAAAATLWRNHLDSTTKQELAFWPGENKQPAPIERALRLPDTF